MFDPITPATSRRRNVTMLGSFAGHLALLSFLLYHATPLFVVPSDVQLGIPHSYGSRSIIYLAPAGPERERTPEVQPKLALHRSPKPAPIRKPEPPPEPPAITAADAPDETARGGSPFGRVPGSPLNFDEVVPAFPVVYPDPPVSNADLPVGVHGDVIVEVSIDSQGNVIRTRLIQGIGYGVEQKVLAVLQQWRFHPAVRDGVTIASQHIVHFHYPG